MRFLALLWLGVGLYAAIQEAEPGQFPYTVSLQVRLRQYQGEGGDYSCTGNPPCDCYFAGR